MQVIIEVRRLTLGLVPLKGLASHSVEMGVVCVELMREAISVQWYQVQAVFNDRDDARMLLRRLVQERITVSGNISGPVLSVVWNGNVEETANRWLVSALSTSGRVHDLVKRITGEYEEPVELVVLPVSFGDTRYLDCLVDWQADTPI